MLLSLFIQRTRKHSAHSDWVGINPCRDKSLELIYPCAALASSTLLIPAVIRSRIIT